ncbi:sodium/calcium exchanger regulatory protein 1-like [Amphibalanus amphitrite]|uniref:sodium/calcium exchanger regulatory protein 1-like n=1 Tax=Amphibalanus amphitrite TaxID=1232801 RepID=UPI001C915C3D|nr:sodium/calcium exchanger regulatory protein 1-like [Amphibalanus amphitrite]
MTETMIGKWKMESSENFDEYMKALDVNVMLRKMASTASPTVEISEQGGTFQLTTCTAFKTTTITFRLGEQFNEETADGRKVKSTMTWEDGTLVHDQKGDTEKGQKDTVLRRTFDGDTMTLKCTVDDITATRVYKREK